MSFGANSGELGVYPSISFGYKSGNVGFEFGGLTYLGGIEDYPVPHNNFTYQGEFNTASLGFDGLYFLEIKNLERLSFFAGIGVYLDQIRGIADSNVSNRRYTQNISYNLSPAFSTGIDVMVPNNEESLNQFRKYFLSFGVGYNTIRGLNIRASFGY